MSKTAKSKKPSRAPAKPLAQKLSPAMRRRLGKTSSNESEKEPTTTDSQDADETTDVKVEESSSSNKESNNQTNTLVEEKTEPLPTVPKKVTRVTFGARIHPELKKKFFRLYRQETMRRDEDFPKGELLEEALNLLFESKGFD